MGDSFRHVLNVVAHNAREIAHELRTLGQPQWLREGHAFDMPITDDPASVLRHARSAAPSATADINIVAALRRRKKLLVADMDSTIISCECLDEIADLAGFGARVAAITERAMRGEIPFEPALRERVSLLKGLPLSLLERVYRERVRLNPGARVLVSTMRAQGAHTLLVSGGFTWFTRRVAHDAGFDEDIANVLLDDGSALTGVVREPVLGRDAKLASLKAAAAAHALTLDDCLAVGDGANDIAMITHAGLGVAFHAKPAVTAAAQASIRHSDLTALLYLQGYREEEFRDDGC